MTCTFNTIGTIIEQAETFAVALEPLYRPGLRGVDGFSHVQVLWLADQADHEGQIEQTDSRSLVLEGTPYVGGPDSAGVFSTRSPVRPNPIGLSVCAVTFVDEAEGLLGLGWIDALAGTPVLDIKPYFPASDRVANVTTPPWFASWPTCLEDSATFDWDSVFVS